MYFWALLAFFALWTVLTLLNQFPGDRWKAWKRFDAFNLIPKWTFFAPTPGTGDLCLLYRLQSASGEMTQFQELTISSGILCSTAPSTRRRGSKSNCWMRRVR